MTYEYQNHARYFAQVAGGIEALGAAELEALGATELETAYRGVYFTADTETLYRLNYQSRLATRILAPLATFDCEDEYALYAHALRVNWSDFMTVDDTFAIFAHVNKSHINHSQYAALRLKDAIVDAWRAQTGGKRPSVERETPDVWFNLHIEEDRATISLDTSGGSLHRRGYRRAAGEAPMQETVAATMIDMCGWDASVPLYDPFCGSGTILAEALMFAANMPASYLRTHFGFQQLPDFNAKLWQAIRQTADAATKPISADLLHGSDVSGRMVKTAKENLEQLPMGRMVNLQTCDFRDVRPTEKSIILCNPPHGIRMGNKADMVQFYQGIGDWLKQSCKGTTAFIYCGERELIGHLRLKPTFKKPLINGQLDGRLVRIDVY